MTTTVVASNKLFINYRRRDSAADAGRVKDRLEKEFGGGSVFMDVDAIPPGMDFVEALDDAGAKCDALLAIIGPKWLEARDDEGNRLLDSESYYVRIEIAAALKRGIPVIPILFGGAQMPKPEQLPNDLKGLVRRNALDIRQASFHRDMDVLVDALRSIFRQSKPDEQSSPSSSDRFMSLSRVIEWIASQGGIRFDPKSDQFAVEERAFLERKYISPRGQELALAYRKAIDEFLHAAFEGKIIVKGFRSGDSNVARQVVPNDCFEKPKAMSWPFCPQDLHYDCLVDDKKHHLEFMVCGEEDGDQIVKGDKVLWSGLLCERADVTSLWPAETRQHSV